MCIRDRYKTSPIQVSLTPQEAEKLSSPMVVEMILQPKGSIDVNVTVGEKAVSYTHLLFPYCG